MPEARFKIWRGDMSGGDFVDYFALDDDRTTTLLDETLPKGSELPLSP